ncbi:hypothetical protein N9N67_10110 [Bacteriovoracaceae bacterium]|nr:hypothetical protein [Bacteriovoracaceae bacterium]
MKNIIFFMLILLLIGGCSKDKKKGHGRKYAFKTKKRSQTRNDKIKSNTNKILLNENKDQGEFSKFIAKISTPQSLDRNFIAEMNVFENGNKIFHQKLTPLKSQLYLYLLKNKYLLRMSANYDLNSIFLLRPEDKFKSIGLNNYVYNHQIDNLDYNIQFPIQKKELIKKSEIFFQKLNFNFLDLSLVKKLSTKRQSSSSNYFYELESYYKRDMETNKIDDHLLLTIQDSTLIKDSIEYNYKDVFDSIKENTFTLIYSDPSQEFTHYLRSGVKLREYLEKKLGKFKTFNCNLISQTGKYTSQKGTWHTNLHNYIDCKTGKIEIENGKVVYFIFEQTNSELPKLNQTIPHDHRISRINGQKSQSVQIERENSENKYLIFNFSSKYYEFDFFSHFFSLKNNCHIFSVKGRNVVKKKSNLYNFDQILKELKVTFRNNRSSLLSNISDKKMVKINNKMYYIAKLLPRTNLSIFLPEKFNYISKFTNICPYNQAKKDIKQAEIIFLSKINTKAAQNHHIYKKMESEAKVLLTVINEK